MARYDEFLPRKRQARFDMAEQWLRVLPDYVKSDAGDMVPKWKHWGIPEERFTSFSNLVKAASEALTDFKDTERNSEVAGKVVREIFKDLVAMMRLIKRNYFHLPPLLVGDFAALGLKVPYQSYTFSGDPFSQITVETFLVGRHELGIRLVYVSGDPNDKANKSFRIHYKIVGPGEAAPTRPEELTLSFPEKRKKFVRGFPYDSSGKTVYFCVQIENNKLVGPFGPMTHAVIP